MTKEEYLAREFAAAALVAFIQLKLYEVHAEEVFTAGVFAMEERAEELGAEQVFDVQAIVKLIDTATVQMEIGWGDEDVQ